MRKLILLSAIIGLTTTTTFANDGTADSTVGLEAAPLVISVESPSDDRFTLPANATESLRNKKVNLTKLHTDYAQLKAEINKLTLQLSFDGAVDQKTSLKIQQMIAQANEMLVLLEDAEHDFVVEKDVFLVDGTDEPLVAVD